MKIKIAIASLIIAQVAVSSAATYLVTSGSTTSSSGVEDTLGRTFRGGTFAGTPFPAGGGVSAGPGSVAFGVFTQPDPAELLTLSAAQLIAAFQEFGDSERNFRTGGPIGFRGLFDSLGSMPVTPSIFSGNPVYLFAGNASSLAESTEFLVVRSDVFVFNPSDDASAAVKMLTFTVDDSTVIIGQVVPDVRTTNGDATTTPGWRMAAVPEPATVCLSSIAVFAMIRRRRNVAAA